MAVELDAAEAKIDDLRSQLDIAAEAQDMLEELTERNLHLQDVRRSVVRFGRKRETLTPSTRVTGQRRAQGRRRRARSA